MADQTNVTSEQELGELYGTYSGQGIVSKLGKLVTGAAFALAAVGAIVWAIYSLIRDVGNLQKLGAFLVFFMPGISCFIGIALLPFAYWMLASVYNSLGLLVKVYTQGFTYTRRGKMQVFRWDDVAEFKIMPYVIGSARSGQASYLSYWVKRKDGLQVTLDQADMSGVPDFGAKLVKEVTKRLLPAAIEAFERGERLTFGEHDSQFSVSKEGLQHKNKLLSWEEIAGVTWDVKESWFQIMRRGAPGKKDKTWAKLFLPAVPNITVFVDLVRHVRKS